MDKVLKSITYYFNILYDCFSNDEPKSPPPYKREIIDSFKTSQGIYDDTEDVRYRRFYKNYNHKEYDYI